MGDRALDCRPWEIRALLDGRKTMLRRVLVKQDWPEAVVGRFPHQKSGVPYRPGDRLWVREGFSRVGDNEDDIHACPDLRVHIYYRADAPCPDQSRWRSPVHMPRWASRVTLVVTEVRVERLQDISEEEARAEGIYARSSAGDDPHADVWCPGPEAWRFPTPRCALQDLWTRTHGPGSWAANPWVAAVRFDVHRANIAALAQEGPDHG